MTPRRTLTAAEVKQQEADIDKVEELLYSATDLVRDAARHMRGSAGYDVDRMKASSEAQRAINKIREALPLIPND
jgi:hypothetical protein